MAHIYGDTRADVMFGAGYATAEERLFAMDALRHAAKGTLAELIGAGGAEMDREQLTDQDFTDEELREQFDDLPRQVRRRRRARRSRTSSTTSPGINARIDEVKSDPTMLPAEYAGAQRQPGRVGRLRHASRWRCCSSRSSPSRTAARSATRMMRLEFRKRFGKRWRARFNDFRNARRPGDVHRRRAREHRSDRPGKRRAGVNLIPDLGSIEPLQPADDGPGRRRAGRDRAVGRARVDSSSAALPHHASNGVVVGSRFSKTGRPLWAAGPQVDYWSPQIFVEYELHGGGHRRHRRDASPAPARGR